DCVFAVGDIAHFEHYGEEPLPGLAPVAIQQGKTAANNISRALEGKSLEEFHYWDRGQMATIGRKAAVGVVGDWHLRGFVAWLAWLFIHLMFLVGFRNKVAVLFDWAYSYVAFKRGARLIVGPPRQGRLEAEEESRSLLESERADEVAE
ncbi:MAG: NAD(P)/FAD-dependent oxidoreductase, partial [Bradymonadaceae bacterium]